MQERFLISFCNTYCVYTASLLFGGDFSVHGPFLDWFKAESCVCIWYMVYGIWYTGIWYRVYGILRSMEYGGILLLARSTDLSR
jgi:hypothetical protein